MNLTESQPVQGYSTISLWNKLFFPQGERRNIEVPATLSRLYKRETSRLALGFLTSAQHLFKIPVS